MLLLHLWALLSSPSAQKQQLTVRFAPYRCDGSQKGVCSGCLEEDNSAVAHGAENDKGYVYGGHLAKELLLSEKSFAAARESAEWNLLWTEQAQRCFDVGVRKGRYPPFVAVVFVAAEVYPRERHAVERLRFSKSRRSNIANTIPPQV